MSFNWFRQIGENTQIPFRQFLVWFANGDMANANGNPDSLRPALGDNKSGRNHKESPGEEVEVVRACDEKRGALRGKDGYWNGSIREEEEELKGDVRLEWGVVSKRRST